MTKEKELWMRTAKIDPNDKGFLLGPYFTDFIKHDMKHCVFTLARYKFVMKMLPSNSSVLEFGCSDGVGTLMLKEKANQILAIDFDERTVNWATKNLTDEKIQFKCSNILTEIFGKFDVIVSLDVIEHIYPENEDKFMQAILNNMADNGMCIIGTPNITAEKYATKNEQHVNLYSGERLYDTFSKYFHNVFSFGMNDEVLHTGYAPMCHYLFVVACNPK
ncbi:class I SAM-dependent methyltransferase [Pseudoalteromonas sp. MMG005]|uniref:class I SAM-dependent methyltransferase n=1 Tax=Pseudoalteromonas sp. MMG005 TaxID=2822682 RepID=UPI001B3A320B|nr:class I SAM-dependent methyltransferase [Pseudoalteromonas sp. MMG005]MBQ4846323.1 class I SAM-dependent methyltransferase [Pseudoalteromonas sp. MMG005]